MTKPDLHAETIDYADTAGTTLKGYLAYDRSRDGVRPGVMVIHEWWGLNDYIRRRARMLAELGYVALALDMYGDGRTAADPEQAGQLMNAVLSDMATGTDRLQAGFARLRSQPQTDADKIAAIGYCFGGAVSLHAARIGMDLAAAVSFHGALGSFHKPAPGEVKARVLVCHGAADSLVPEADVAAFRQEMDAARVDYRFTAYDGALHGFTNPEATENGAKYGLPLGYDAAADRQSWQAMESFLAESFQARG